MNPTKVLFILSLVNATKHFATAAPPRNDWSKLDLATLEEDWREGDEAEELATPDDELYNLLDRKRKHASDRMEYFMSDSGAQNNDKALEQAALDAQHAVKAVMIFATLREDGAPKNSNGWDWESMAEVCDEWSVSDGVLIGRQPV